MNTFEIKVTIDAPELAKAIMTLAQALAKGMSNSDSPTAVKAKPEPQPEPIQIPQPIATITPQVPTAAPAYSFEELARAGADLASISPEHRAKILSLLNNTFRIATLIELKPEQYGEYATALRSLGANI